jgi:hypothetical protein
VPITSAGLNKLLFLLRPLTVLMRQTRQAVCAVKQSIYFDVYGKDPTVWLDELDRPNKS